MGRLIKLKITKLDAENAMQASVIDYPPCHFIDDDEQKLQGFHMAY
jgi:hypothetical protein